MKRKLACLLMMLVCIFVLAACGKNQDSAGKDSSYPDNNAENQNTENQNAENQNAEKQNTVPQAGQDTGKGEAQQDASKAYATRINISINPDADILTYENGKAVEIVCNNDDAVTAYGNLDVNGLGIKEVVDMMVKAAVDAGFMQDEMPVTLTIVDSALSGQDLMDEALMVKDGVQQALMDEDFQNAPIQAEIAAQEEVEDHTCDLCFGTGLLVCEECHGTTYLDGNAWTTCNMCGGQGGTNCTLCEGAGTMPCDGCGGTGADASQEDGLCFGCHGAGYTNCVRCGGAGSQECYDCKGAGRLGGFPCNHCGGTLWGMCNRCQGSGIMNN